MRILPKLNYIGLTVILSNKSRFDTVALLSANGGQFFKDECLRPEVNFMMCDIRLSDDKSPFLEGTKCVLLLGYGSVVTHLGLTNNTLGEIRGSPYVLKESGIVAIASYSPQDAVDIKDYEGEFNDDATDYSNTDEAKDTGEKRHHGATDRKNWRFWLKKDTKKALSLCLKYNGVIPAPQFIPNYKIYPPLDEVITVLKTNKQQELYIDIETDRNLHVTTFGFSFGNSNDIYVVPFVSYDYSPAYSNFIYFIQSLSIAIKDNLVIAHNGSGFDFLVLPLQYRIPVGYNYWDSMLSQHRSYPEVEKSLGHCMSLWTWQPFHKDEGDFSYSTPQNARANWEYCGKDVYGMRLIKLAIDAHAKTIPGLTESIAQVNSSIRAYLLMTLKGIHYKKEKLDEYVSEQNNLMYQYLRCIRLLIGEDTAKTIQKGSKNSMPGSNNQCIRYFHDMLGYKVVMRSKKTGKPSLGKKAIYNLRLKEQNIVLDFCIKYRQVARNVGSLQFNPLYEQQ